MSASGSYLTLNALRIGRLFVMSTGEPLYGHQIAKQTGVNRDSTYRILRAMRETSLLTSEAECQFDANMAKRQARTLYRLTDAGVFVIKSALTALQIPST